MTVLLEERAVFCRVCSAPTGDYTTTGETSVVGRCCENLANPYRQNGNGQYVRPDGVRDPDYTLDEDDDEPEETYWQCEHCGSHEILVDACRPMYYQVRIDTTEHEPGQDNFEVDMSQDHDPGYGEIEVTDTSCGNCGRPAHVGIS